MTDVGGPNPLRVAWSMLTSLRSTRRPDATGSGTLQHRELLSVLETLREQGVAALPGLREQIASYRRRMEDVEPDNLSRPHALAYWMNLYNAGALDLAASARSAGAPSVLRVPGGFREPWTTVAGEHLSLDAIEHGKIRRFRDPRIHGALVCGSASCPTLRYEPFDGSRLESQLDDQMTRFLSEGGAIVDGDVVLVSRVFLWFGGDLVRPHRMPTAVPASRRAVGRRLVPWLPEEARVALVDGGAAVRYQPYDWSLACTVR